MTAHDEHLPTTATSAGASARDTVTRDNRYSASASVPVIVWRTTPDEPDATSDTDADDSPLTSRLAHYLVAIYGDVHSTVVDFDADDNLRHAAEATGRRYVPIASQTDPTPITVQRPPAVLIVLRWPRPATTTPAVPAPALLDACQRHLADNGSIVVAITAANAGQPGTTYTEHEQILLPAAKAAGLHHLHDIVPLVAADGRDAFTYATSHDAMAASCDTNADTVRQTTSTTLVIFGRPRRRP
jgi:hypothetical protein